MRLNACRPLRLGLPIAALVLALIIACSGSSPDGSQTNQVRGIVLEVVGRNIIELESVRIRDEAGKEWNFGSGQGFIGFSPSHLREHQLAGETVAVTYVTQGGELIAVDITD